MKKTLLVALALWVCHAASAQWSWSAKAGLNLSTLTEQDYYGGSPEVVPKKGFYGGVAVEYRFGRFCGLQSELTYSAQGWEGIWRDMADSYVSFSEKHVRKRLNYINLPILLRFYPLRTLAIEAGPQAGYLFRYDEFSSARLSEGTYTRDKQVLKYIHRIDRSEYDSFDLGVAVGLSWMFVPGVSATARSYVGKIPFRYDSRNQMCQFGVSVKL